LKPNACPDGNLAGMIGMPIHLPFCGRHEEDLLFYYKFFYISLHFALLGIMQCTIGPVLSMP
jgi:hypothetical protein